MIILTMHSLVLYYSLEFTKKPLSMNEIGKLLCELNNIGAQKAWGFHPPTSGLLSIAENHSIWRN